MQSKNRLKLPSWIGSIFLHGVLLAVILFWFSLSPVPRSAPGERFAAGNIVMQSAKDVQQQSESAPAASLPSLPRVEYTPLLPDILTLAPGQATAPPADIESAIDWTEAFQQQNSIGGNIGTGETTVKIFGTQGKGTKFMYVFDRSGSMEGTPIHRAKLELIASLDSLGEFHQFNILFYSSEWRLWKPGKTLVFATPGEKKNAEQFVKEILPAGNTQHFEPIMEAVAHRPDVIFFLTDGQSQDDLTPEQLRQIDQINSRFGTGTQINVIQFGIGGIIDRPSQVLQQLAAENHGEYQYINVKEL